MLYLKKIEMYGFKSFADKIELKFDQPITGIVGPNGCGKSNVSDSIRWVLGEQSTRTLRGKTMQDLIFNGTDTRKSMSYCEVSLYLDNSTRLFPIQMDEIIISRKLYRNNESEYLLNRNVVRLKDILDMLRSVGLGKEGYSIVGQGRMDAILNAKPEDRRAIFEEAMGISRFRAKKVETERKLEKTHLNMDTLSVISKELEKQVGPLRKQSEVAMKYLNLRDQLRYNEINAYIYGYDNASTEKENAKKKLDGLGEEYLQKEAEYAAANERHDELFNKRNEIDVYLSQLRDRQLTLAVDLQKQAGNKDLVQERIGTCRRDLEETERQIAEALEEKQRLEKEIEQAKQLKERRAEEKVQLETEISALTDKFADLNKRMESISGDSENVRKRLDEVLAALSECTGKLASYETEKETIQTRLAAIAESEREISERLKEAQGEEGDLLQRYEDLRKRHEELDKSASEQRKQIKQQEYAQFEMSREVLKKQQAYAGEKGGIDLLQDFAKNYKGYQASVQNLMQDARHDEELAERICGVVANLLHVEPRLQTAIEAALGARLQNVVTENEQDTKYVIQYLKDNDYGRVTFLPISSMKPHGIERPEVLREQGVLGIANSLVSYDSKYSSVFQSLLGGIVVVDTFDNAVAISRKYRYVHRMVTLTGERIANDGSMEGGSKRNANGNLLSYETQIAARTKKLQELKADLDASEAKKAEVDGKLAEMRNLLSNTEKEISEVNVALAADREKIEASNLLNNSDKKTILGLSTEKEKMTQRLSKLTELQAKYTARMQELNSAEKKIRKKIDDFKGASQEETSAKDALSEQLSNKRYRLAVLSSNIEASEREIKTDEQQIVSLDDASVTKRKYADQLQKALDQLYEVLNEASADSESQREMTDVLEKIKSVDQFKAKLEEDFRIAGEERLRLSGELENVRGLIDKQQYILQSIDDDLAELQQRVYEEYGITYSAAMQYKDEEFQYEGNKERIAELKGAIQKLGAVNVNAIEDLKTVEERYGDISGQMDDLRKAEDDLKQILDDLTVQIESRFSVGMEKINENFKVVFRELFNGGNARLSVDVDETKAPLDYGIEIEAQPPGKKLQNISLLSGGERTLTACAILFAILKYNPMPFCVLDEIEAALDDANAERIAKFLRKFSSSTQFIVITHKKPTMENADVLYGVTMEEKGVSKIVSVKLTDAIKQAE